MTILIAIACVILAYIIWQYIELQKFRVTRYTLSSEKIDQKMRIVMLSDLHCKKYKRENEELFRKIREEAPDLILIPGDLIVAKQEKKYSYAAEIIEKLKDICPIYFARGNHEGRVAQFADSDFGREYLAVEQRMKELGCHVLLNERETIEVCKNPLTIYGLDLDMGYYVKGVKVRMSDTSMEHTMGPIDPDTYGILLAHNPAYGTQYAKWGADLTVCGHNHGGLICIPGIGSVISPQFEFFPKFSCGDYVEEGRHIIVGRGLGTHTFHIRIFNRAEIVSIGLCPANSKKKEVRA